MAHEFDGKKYEQASAHQKEWGAKLIAELDLKGNESVLDLGCGDGVLTTKIAKQLPAGRVLGIDAFPWNMLCFASISHYIGNACNVLEAGRKSLG